MTRLSTKEEGLLDLAGDDTMPQQRIRDIAREREKLTEQLNKVDADLSRGRTYLEAYLELLKSPYELYRNARNPFRRKLNQTFFAHLYIAFDEVTGDDIRMPIREMLAAEQGWQARRAGRTEAEARQAALAEIARRSGPETPKAAPKGGLADLQKLWLDLGNGVYEDADCSKPYLVELGGVRSQDIVRTCLESSFAAWGG
ncbi:hypothetical protein NLU66_13510 [Brachybacterium sp. NBEC-018]|uniref:hypothetical protein n=1 Tax=Brachybacterium sp. NBEC-018 TaxID=2996004 RepID=UPI002174D1CC|nr:hypothetical protein [Brachybacterium sp. NBEC-018]UVY83221.1 hypothetical protein NLU66_13510 [Brachybacterium sp. NBEC-018]